MLKAVQKPFPLLRQCQRSTYVTKIDQQVRLKIGEATEILVRETERYLDRRHVPHLEGLLAGDVKLLIQNAPDDVLLHVNGEGMYRRSYGVLRWTLRMWYGWRFKQLRVQVCTVPPKEVPELYHLRLRWRVEGVKQAFMSTEETVVPVLSGYSYYQFEPKTGLIKQHLVDRLVPPAARGSLLWRYLEWFRTPSLPPRPIVGSSKSHRE